jgi:hypothetical protein
MSLTGFSARLESSCGFGGVARIRRYTSSRRFSLSPMGSVMVLSKQEEVRVVRDLPASLTREIGRVMVHYAHLEYRMSAITANLLGVSRTEGRMALREPRLKEWLALLVQLMRAKGLEPQIGIPLLQTVFEQATIQRDQLAHNIWCRNPKYPGRVFLRLIKGSWQPVKGQRGKTSRVTEPEAIEYDADDARSLVALIEAAIEKLNELGFQIYCAAGEPLREPIQLSQPKNPTPNRKRAKPQRPPEPSGT